MIKTIAFGMIAAATLAAPLAASATGNRDRVMMRQGAVIHALETTSRLSPGDGGAKVELASAYWQAGRTAEANAAYREALKLDDVMLETKTGDAIWSHEVARRVLARTVALSAR